LKQGIKNYGEKGKQATVTEIKQLHDRSCFKPLDVNKLADKQRRQAMNSLFFITEKIELVELKGELRQMEVLVSVGEIYSVVETYQFIRNYKHL